MRIRILLLAALLGAVVAGAAALAQPQQRQDEQEFDALEGASPDVALVARLLMMKGHLRVGRELYRLGDRDGATGHFLHPLVELDGDVEPDLAARNLQPVKPELEALAAASEKGDDETSRAFEAASAAIERALLPAATKLRRSAPESFELFLRLADQAAHEYANGIEDGKVFAPVEYQDARGFLLSGREALKGFADPLATKSNDGYLDLDREWKGMLEATPGAEPPERVEVRPDRLRASVRRIDAMRPLFQ